MKNIRYIGLMIFASTLYACDTEVGNNGETHSEQKEEIGYSDSERSELKNAVGREATNLTADIFDNLLSQNELVIFHINNIHKADNFKMLEKLENEFSGRFKLVHLIHDKNSTTASVNLFIRENNLTGEAFLLKNISLSEGIAKKWSGDFPAVWIVNESEGIDLLYEQILTEEEMITILQPVTL